MTIPDENAHHEPPKDMTDPEYRRIRRKTMVPFNFELDKPRRAQLRQIADIRGISMGATLRQLISTAALMHLEHRPHCVSGRDCFMPHIHPQDSPSRNPHGNDA